MPRHLTEHSCGACGATFLSRVRPYSTRYCSNVCRKSGAAVPVEKRFWGKVEKSDGCWIWVGGRWPLGYGRIKSSKPPHLGLFAHRVSWELTNGPIPDGLQICHHCDNPPCVRPDHLFLGTQRDNIHDMMAKGRHGDWDRRGERNPCAKLTPDMVRELRRLHAGRERTFDQLAAQFHIARSNVYRIVSRQTWREVA